MTPKEIIALRKMMGISQAKMAMMLGANAPTVNRWEKGKCIPCRLYEIELNKLREQHDLLAGKTIRKKP